MSINFLSIASFSKTNVDSNLSYFSIYKFDKKIRSCNWWYSENWSKIITSIIGYFDFFIIFFDVFSFYEYFYVNVRIFFSKIKIDWHYPGMYYSN